MISGESNKVLCVVGARPNFMKIAPLLKAFSRPPIDIRSYLVHTGQHYSYSMNEAFFQQLGIPAPDISLEVGSGTHASQTAEIMKRFEPIIASQRPDIVLVVGDVNSTLACALVAAKMQTKIVHVEAGLRSRDRSMPEEINRLLTDQLSDRLYVTEREAVENLAKEGIDRSKIVFAGNVMIDTLHQSLAHAVPTEITLRAAGIEPPSMFGVLTLHRPSNVDDPSKLGPLLEVLRSLATQLPLIFPLHPRTEASIRAAGLSDFLSDPCIIALPPVGYLEMLGFMRDSTMVLTDSGGLQEETTALGVPCLTLRNSTERPVTISQGTNTLVGTDPSKIRQCYEDVLAGRGKSGRQPELWDGHSSERIAIDLHEWLKSVSLAHRSSV